MKRVAQQPWRPTWREIVNIWQRRARRARQRRALNSPLDIEMLEQHPVYKRLAALAKPVDKDVYLRSRV